MTKHGITFRKISYEALYQDTNTSTKMCKMLSKPNVSFAKPLLFHKYSFKCFLS